MIGSGWAAQAAGLGLLSLALLCPQETAPEWSPSERRRIAQHSPLGSPPPEPSNRFADDQRAAELGRRLFYDARLSRTATLSCASCHQPERAFTDGLSVAEGAGIGQRNTPSIWNAAHQRWYFWDGRADTLWSQALGPIENARELDGSRTALVHLLGSDPELKSSYEALFGALPERAGLPARAHPIGSGGSGGSGESGGAGVDQRAWLALAPEVRVAIDRVFVNVGKALEAYQRRLHSGDSRFDRFAELLRAEDPRASAALTPSEQRGLVLFVGKAGCRVCHSGPNFSDGEFHALRLSAPPGSASSGKAAAGRFDGLTELQRSPFNALGSFSDDPNGARAQRLRASLQSPELWGQFKTPSLRNVALTAPYMHAGQLASVEEVLHFYNTLEGMEAGGHHQETVLLPLGFQPSELTDLGAFLRTLSAASVPPDLGPP